MIKTDKKLRSFLSKAFGEAPEGLESIVDVQGQVATATVFVPVRAVD